MQDIEVVEDFGHVGVIEVVEVVGHMQSWVKVVNRAAVDWPPRVVGYTLGRTKRGYNLGHVSR